MFHNLSKDLHPVLKNAGKNSDVAPVLQSMQDYISNHYVDELLDEVSAAIQLQLVENLDAKGGNFVLDRNESI